MATASSFSSSSAFFLASLLAISTSLTWNWALYFSRRWFSYLSWMSLLAMLCLTSVRVSSCYCRQPWYIWSKLTFDINVSHSSHNLYFFLSILESLRLGEDEHSVHTETPQRLQLCFFLSLETSMDDIFPEKLVLHRWQISDFCFTTVVGSNSSGKLSSSLSKNVLTVSIYSIITCCQRFSATPDAFSW